MRFRRKIFTAGKLVETLITCKWTNLEKVLLKSLAEATFAWSEEFEWKKMKSQDPWTQANFLTKERKKLLAGIRSDEIQMNRGSLFLIELLPIHFMKKIFRVWRKIWWKWQVSQPDHSQTFLPWAFSDRKNGFYEKLLMWAAQKSFLFNVKLEKFIKYAQNLFPCFFFSFREKVGSWKNKSTNWFVPEKFSVSKSLNPYSY